MSSREGSSSPAGLSARRNPAASSKPRISSRKSAAATSPRTVPERCPSARTSSRSRSNPAMLSSMAARTSRSSARVSAKDRSRAISPNSGSASSPDAWPTNVAKSPPKAARASSSRPRTVAPASPRTATSKPVFDPKCLNNVGSEQPAATAIDEVDARSTPTAANVSRAASIRRRRVCCPVPRATQQSMVSNH